MPGSRAIIHAHRYSNGLKKAENLRGREVMRRKAPRTVHTPSCKSFLLLMHYSAGQAGRCTTQLSRWFMGNKGRCQRGLLHNGSIKSRAEQWLNSHMAIATVGGERESPLDCGRTLKDCGHSVLLYHSVLCCFFFFLNQKLLSAELHLNLGFQEHDQIG